MYIIFFLTRELNELAQAHKRAEMILSLGYLTSRVVGLTATMDLVRRAHVLGCPRPRANPGRPSSASSVTREAFRIPDLTRVENYVTTDHQIRSLPFRQQ
jgi:hypothetical protein